MYVSVAVCLHLNESICSTCTYECVWKPYSDVNASCACASYSLIICNLCVMGREYLLFVFRLLWVFVYHISPDYFGDDLCSIQLCAFAFVPWFSFLHCHVLSSCTFSFSCLHAQLFVCANNKMLCQCSVVQMQQIVLLFWVFIDLFHRYLTHWVKVLLIPTFL